MSWNSEDMHLICRALIPGLRLGSFTWPRVTPGVAQHGHLRQLDYNMEKLLLVNYGIIKVGETSDH